MTFRAYLLDDLDRIIRGEWVEAEDPQDAALKAEALWSVERPNVEIWLGAQRVRDHRQGPAPVGSVAPRLVNHQQPRPDLIRSSDMPTYRVYRTEQSGKIRAGDRFDAASDDAARIYAQDLCNKDTPAVELWQGGRLICRLDCTGKASRPRGKAR